MGVIKISMFFFGRYAGISPLARMDYISWRLGEMEIEIRYLTDREVAKLTGIAFQTLRNWRSCGRGPSYIKYGVVRYEISDVVKFLNEHKIPPMGEDK